MKLVALLSLGFFAALGDDPAWAQTKITLPEPSIQSISGAYCASAITPNDAAYPYAQQYMSAWSAAGTQLTAYTEGQYPCGHSGRDTNLTYYHWCGTFTWTVTFDASGNLNPIAIAVYTPTASCVGYAQWPVFQTVYNSSGVGATMGYIQFDYGYHGEAAKLVTP